MSGPKSQVQIESLEWGESRTLLLHGEPGVGKSRTAAELLRIALDRGMSGRWWRCADLVGNVIRGTVSASRLGADFVVLDDVDRGVGSSAARDILDQVILAQYERYGSKMVFTSNGGVSSIYSKLSAAAGDRIRSGLIVGMGGESLRGME